MDIVVIAKVIVVDESGKILLLRRSKSDVRRPLQWDIPGGHSDGGELPAETAVRETLEECGLRVKLRQLKLVYAMTESFQHDVSAKSVTWLFHITNVGPGQPNVTLSSEHVEYRWVTLTEAVKTIEYERQRRALAYIHENSLLQA